MNEIYRAIEEKIKASGYSGTFTGEEVYNDICDEIEDKENGTYLLLSKKENGDTFTYNVSIFDDDFNLSILKINSGEDEFIINFDE
ncbi:hypothetical protein EXD82_06585 [Peptacetobacter hominis]|uniref:Uncharacterized protein n=1 Tax=Peptacetobacter hominis TaxID=2743610 RepID=A0A544QUW1_9FIRM|nr:hypothetical protein [Peptacetobacter hominis]TQQ84467.1 hypothetical protein EXD82_06585 [Peptacetobacter hominis]